MERPRGERNGQQCLSMYNITENIYYSQLSSVVILLQPEPVSHCIIQGKDFVLSPSVLLSCSLPLPPVWLFLMVNEARSYFASSILSLLVVGLKISSLPTFAKNQLTNALCHT
jgi:hypothetical protein